MNFNTSPTRISSRAERNRADTVPRDFDPATFPIIARHFFGIEPLRPIGVIAAEVLTDLRLRPNVICLDRQDPRQ